MSSVCLPYCIYFVLFAKLKQCANWYKSQLSDGFTRKLLGLQRTYSHIRITLLQSTIMTFSGRFPKFLCSSIAIIFNNLVNKFLNVLNCCGKKRVALVFMTEIFCVDYETAHKHKTSCQVNERSSFTIKNFSNTPFSKNLYRVETSQNVTLNLNILFICFCSIVWVQSINEMNLLWIMCILYRTS